VPSNDPNDLMHSIKGMYRILDLISETGSGGLGKPHTSGLTYNPPSLRTTVEKVIIDQESLKRFVNDVSPGAYVSLTRIDFRALDNSSIKPVGVYGSRERIVELFLEVGSIEPYLFVVPAASYMVPACRLQPRSANALVSSRDNSVAPHLRSGIYFVQPPSHSHDDPRVFVVYWPEETTWNDDAVSSVKRNRVTFMRCHGKPPHQRHSLNKLRQVPDKDS